MATITGNNNANILIGTNSGDVINAGGGCDIVLAGNGNDRIDGGAGSDLISGGNGNDTIDGGAGAEDLLRCYFVVPFFSSEDVVTPIPLLTAINSCRVRFMFSDEPSRKITLPCPSSAK